MFGVVGGAISVHGILPPGFIGEGVWFSADFKSPSDTVSTSGLTGVGLAGLFFGGLAGIFFSGVPVGGELLTFGGTVPVGGLGGFGGGGGLGSVVVVGGAFGRRARVVIVISSNAKF